MKFFHQIPAQRKEPQNVGGNAKIDKVTKEEFYRKVETKLRGLNRSKSTIDLYIAANKKFISFCDNKDLSDINSSDFEDFTKAALKRKLKPGTLRTYKFGINFGFNEILNKNIDVSVMPTPQRLRLTQEYFEKNELLAFFEKISNIKHKAIIELMYSAGLDIIEVLNVKVKDVKSDKKQIIIRNTRGEIVREAYLSPLILELLRKYYIMYKPSNYLFEGQSKDEPLTDRTVQHIFKTALLASGINKELTTRSLKTTYIKHLVDDGIPINIILSNLKIDNGDTIKNYMDLCYPVKKYNRSPIDSLKVENDDSEYFDTSDLEYLLTKVKDKQERDYLLEGIKCFKANALRAGVIFLWSAAIYKIQNKCMNVKNGYLNTELKKIYRNAKDIKVIEDFEYIKDEYLLDVACNVKIFDKSIKEELKNTCLELRNRCSHPGRYKPKSQKIRAYVEDIIGMLY